MTPQLQITKQNSTSWSAVSEFLLCQSLPRTVILKGKIMLKFDVVSIMPYKPKFSHYVWCLIKTFNLRKGAK